MNEIDIIRYSRRYDADRTAQEIREREIRINRDTLGLMKATQHADKIAGDWLRTKYNEIENDLPL